MNCAIGKKDQVKIKNAVSENRQKIYQPEARVNEKFNPEAFHLFDGATGVSLGT